MTTAQTHNTGQRNIFVDAAKGVSIFLVVYWHSVDNLLRINEALWLLRMPLFFFVSGLFANRAMALPWADFLKTKVGNIFYLYILWTFIVFFTTIFVAQTFGPDRIDIGGPFLLFVQPPQTLWFMYALGISFLIAKLIRPLAWWPIFLLAFAAYCWSIYGGNWRTAPFPDKVIRLLPFFLLALKFPQPAIQFAARHSRWGLPALAVFVALILLIFETGLVLVGPITFALGLLGVFSVLMTASAFQSSLITKALAQIGQRTLFIYVMHRIPLFYGTHAMEYLQIDQNALTMSVLAVLVTAACYFIGEYVIQRWLPWLFTAPWARHKASAMKSA